MVVVHFLVGNNAVRFSAYFLNNAPILLLDEPTEGLDRETERQIYV